MRGGNVLKSALISVIIPAYNREKVIERSVRSVLAQDYQNIEVIVVDDCSTDNTVSVVQAIRDSRLRLVRQQQNQGACAARNVGIALAKGQVIAFNDSDDSWREDKLTQQLLALEHNDVDVVFCKIRKNFLDTTHQEFPNLAEGEVPYAQLIESSKCSTQTLMGKAEVFKNVLFDETVPRMQDFDFVIRAGEKFKFYFLNETLVDVYLQSDSITSTDTQKLYAIHAFLAKKYERLFSQYPSFAEYLLSSLGYFSALTRNEPAYPIFKQLYRYHPTIINFFKMFFSKLGILQLYWLL